MPEVVPQSSRGERRALRRERRVMESGQQESNEKSSDDQALVRRVAERVWELWREDMRRSRERVGKQRGS